MFIRNIYDNYTGNHIKWLFRGTVICSKKGESESHIQIDKKSETLTVTWAYDSDSFGADAYLEHGKAQITAIEGVSDFQLCSEAIREMLRAEILRFRQERR